MLRLFKALRAGFGVDDAYNHVCDQLPSLFTQCGLHMFVCSSAAGGAIKIS